MKGALFFGGCRSTALVRFANCQQIVIARAASQPWLQRFSQRSDVNR